MNKITPISILIMVVVLFGAGAFYWYEWRPTQIKKDCAGIAQDKAIEKGRGRGLSDGKYNKDDRNQYYQWCLEKNGL